MPQGVSPINYLRQAGQQPRGVAPGYPPSPTNPAPAPPSSFNPATGMNNPAFNPATPTWQQQQGLNVLQGETNIKSGAERGLVQQQIDAQRAMAGLQNGYNNNTQTQNQNFAREQQSNVNSHNLAELDAQKHMAQLGQSGQGSDPYAEAARQHAQSIASQNAQNAQNSYNNSSNPNSSQNTNNELAILAAKAAAQERLQAGQIQGQKDLQTGDYTGRNQLQEGNIAGQKGIQSADIAAQMARLQEGEGFSSRFLAQQGDLQAASDARRQAMISGLLGHLDSSGSGGTLPLGGPSSTQEDQARSAAFARAKDQAGQTGRAAVNALQSVAGGRGLVGSGYAANNASGIINQGQQQVGDVTRGQAESDVQNARQRASEQYQGALTRRGQNMGFASSLMGLMNSRAY